MTTLEVNTSNIGKIRELIEFASNKLHFDVKVVKKIDSIEFEQFSENELSDLKKEGKDSFLSISKSLKSI